MAKHRPQERLVLASATEGSRAETSNSGPRTGPVGDSSSHSMIAVQILLPRSLLFLPARFRATRSVLRSACRKAPFLGSSSGPC